MKFVVEDKVFEKVPDMYIGVVAVVLGITYLLLDRMMVYRDRAS